MDFTGKTVLVTGAAGNLGRAVAQMFADRNARLALLDQNEGALSAAYAGETAPKFECAVDLLDQAAVEDAMDKIAGSVGGPHVVCAIAGGFHMGEAVHETPEDKWALMMDMNVRTLLNTVHAAVPRMLAKGDGKIVTIGAAAARQGMAQMGAYCASKSAVIRLTESLSAELRENSINVNCVLPSILNTPQNREAMPDADHAKWVTLPQLANVICFLASDQASAIHGAAIPVVGLS